ncbi:MAG: hypothetical protein ABI640_10125 [Gammaproteobacteria bacterium]
MKPTLASWLALAAAFLPALGHAQVVQIPNSTVTLAAPAGFRVARNFVGLENTATGSMIQIAEYPPDQYAEVSSVFASPKTASTRYASEGVRITRIEPVSLESGSVPLAIGQQVKNGKEFQKYISVFGGGEAKAVLVTFTIGAGQSMSRSDVEAVVRSIKVKRLPTQEELFAQLSFVFKPAPPLRFTTAPDPYTAMLSTFDGNDDTGLKPIARITRVGTSALPSESAKMAEQSLKSMAANAVIKERANVAFAGGQGAYLSAVVDKRTVMLFLRVQPGGSYLQLLAVGETAQMAEVASVVKETAASVELR